MNFWAIHTQKLTGPARQLQNRQLHDTIKRQGRTGPVFAYRGEFCVENLIFSLNATLPIFLVMVVGGILGRLGFLPREFCKASDKLTFKITLPIMLFLDMSDVDMRHDFQPKFVLFCFGATLISILVIWGLARALLRDKTIIGEFVQASYRSSAAVLGVAFIQNIYGDAGMAPLMILGSVPLFNIFAVLILMIEAPGKQRATPRPGQLLYGVVTNPILLGIVAGTVFSLLPVELPTIADKTLNSLASLTTPLALLSIGASFEGTKALQKAGPTLVAALLKTAGLSAIFIPCAVALGFREKELVALLIMLGSPTTPSSYVMAKNMGHEGVLTASTVAATTLLSALTLTAWIFILHGGGWL